jgi:L-seryl-tRNA(Ser) seleniumtransferase
MIDPSQQERLRQIPAVDRLLLQPRVARWISRTSRALVVSEIQSLLREIRSAILSSEPLGDGMLEPDILESRLEERMKDRLRPSLRTLINATGVVLHTNLGRAPLSSAAQESLSAVSSRYTNLEFDLHTGERWQRHRIIEPLLAELLGCEAATVVNNNAAAVFLILNTLAFGKQVIVSRGELVEIGGSFRIPEILSRSGAVLREVGTTNKTRIRDYEAAIGPETALLLRVHPSNYRVRGFTARPDLDEMVRLARQHGLPLVEDIGSGCLVDLSPYGIREEPLAQESIRAGVDLLCFSADKLLGGPQAGIIAGGRKWIDPIRSNPLLRTYRVEKLIYGALEGTLASYRTGRAMEEIPVLRMIRTSRDEVRSRARRFVRRLRKRLDGSVLVDLVAGSSVIGGGACPDTLLETTLISFVSDRLRPDTIEARLRAYDPPVVARVEEDRILVDLRTVFPEQESELQDSLVDALRPV